MFNICKHRKQCNTKAIYFNCMHILFQNTIPGCFTAIPHCLICGNPSAWDECAFCMVKRTQGEQNDEIHYHEIYE